MGYRAGIGERLAALMKVPAGDPHLFCDGCKRKRTVCRSRDIALPYAWFMNNRRAPGWTKERAKKDEPRVDYCPRCTEKQKANA